MLGILVHNPDMEERPVAHTPMLPQWMRRAFASLFRRSESRHN